MLKYSLPELKPYNKPKLKNKTILTIKDLEDQSQELGNFMYTMTYFEGPDKRMRQVEGICERVFPMIEALGKTSEVKLMIDFINKHYKSAVRHYSQNDEGWKISQTMLSECLIQLNRLITTYKLAKVNTSLLSFGADTISMEDEKGEKRSR